VIGVPSRCSSKKTFCPKPGAKVNDIGRRIQKISGSSGLGMCPRVLELLALFAQFVAILPAFTPQPSNLALQDVEMDFRQRLLAEMVDVSFSSPNSSGR
jgi:hypothetical protein